MYEITIGELRAAVPRISEANARLWAGPLSKACEAFKINTPLRIAHFLAQLGHESWDFVHVEENLRYSAQRLLQVFPKYFANPALAQQYANNPKAIGSRVYANRMGNGSEASAEGYYYRGRGLIQITGKSNYDAVTDWLEGFGAPDFVAFPNKLLETEWAAMSAGAYWSHNNLNYWADRDDIVTITKRINGGTNGLDDRRSRLAVAKKALANYERSRAK